MKAFSVGSYEVTERLGEGAFGMVYAGHHRILGRRAALKFLKGSNVKEHMDRRLLLFTREAYVLGQLDHDHIVRIYDAFPSEYGPCIAMEFIDGSDLETLSGSKDLSHSDRAKYIYQILSALGAAHDMDIVHRDLKPTNILVTSTDDVKLADFGIAAGTEDDFLKTSATAGTLPYMAPEQLAGYDPHPCSDLWSVGVIVYQLFTGAFPFTGRTEVQLHKNIMAGQYNRLNPATCPKWACALVEGALQTYPEDRFSSCEEMMKLLPVRPQGIRASDLNPEALLEKLLVVMPGKGTWVDKEQAIRDAARQFGIQRVGRNIRREFIKALLRGQRRGLIEMNADDRIAKV